MKEGTTLLLDDGKLRLKVISALDEQILTCVEVGGELSNKKGLNIPDARLPISALTEKDKIDLEFGLSLEVDFIALSFVQSPEDVLMAREIIGNKAKIISKLEKPLAIEYLEEIIELSDGVMVARGDLGVEMPIEYVPSIQKRIIHLCRTVGKPVIVATQMLESMIHVPTPTRAEASDVATAVYDGADAVMLSAESASGKYPIETVRMMNKLIQSTEKDPYARVMWDAHRKPTQIVEVDSVVLAVREIANLSKSLGIAVFTSSGRTVLRVVRERPYSPIFGLTHHLQTARFMTLLWGVQPILVEMIQNLDHMVEIATTSIAKSSLQKGQIIIMAGIPFGGDSAPNILRIIQI
jgi:pyruvate kinase